MTNRAALLIGLGVMLAAAAAYGGFTQVDDFFALPSGDRAQWVGALGSVAAIVFSVVLALFIDRSAARRAERERRAETAGHYDAASAVLFDVAKNAEAALDAFLAEADTAQQVKELNEARTLAMNVMARLQEHPPNAELLLFSQRVRGLADHVEGIEQRIWAAGGPALRSRDDIIHAMRARISKLHALDREIRTAGGLPVR